MTDKPRLHVVNGAQAVGQAKPGLTHVYAIAPRNDGLWGVFCYGCSSAVSEYVYPCRVLNDDERKRPPAVLAGPKKLVEMQKNLETSNQVMASIADQLDLWDDGVETVNTEDIYAAIERLKERP